MKKKILVLTLITLIIMVLGANSVYAVDRPDDTWVPSSGYANTWNYDDYTRKCYCDWWWNSSYSLSGLKADSNETLEMDLVFPNDSDQAFMYSIVYATRPTWWDTNQPRPYLDTQFDDSNEWRPFCVGCSDANLFNVQSYYYWWIRSEKTPSSGSNCYVSPQRGYRSPSSIYENAYNVFSEETHWGLRVFWAPGNVSWNFP